MIHFFSILTLICLASSGILAQSVFRIDSLPEQGVLLDKGWKFHAGDNPDWAKPNFDDSQWESIEPTKDIFDLPQLDRETGRIGWFRLRLALDITLARQLVLQIRQSGASEVYLNGRLIHRFGRIGKTPAETEAFTPNNSPVSFPASMGREQVLAVLYALQPGIRYGQHFGPNNPGLSVRLNTTEQSTSAYRQLMLSERGGTLFVGSLGVLGLLFLTFFLFFPARKEALYFALFCLALVFTWLTFYYVHLPVYIQDLFFWKNFILVMQALGYPCLLLSVYTILAQKCGWIFWSLVGLSAVSIYCGIYLYPWGWLVFGYGVTNLINLDATRVALLATRRGQKGVQIIVVGGVIYMIAWLLFCFQFLNIYTIDLDLFSISILSIPASYAIYFGYDFGMTNRSLRQKLSEVETLSTEKQQILATQNEILERQVGERTAELNHSLTELKATQTQLIQKEKMASLGELTAGIAHEIQNPLNFVNNFSEVSTELVSELEDEHQKPTRDIELEAELLGDLKQNLQKITYHGGRASSIVQGMLEHSRTSTGERQPTDLNALADEYLRLAYQGLRAKDKSSNAELKTDFAPNLGLVEVVPQDIGRVLLNLFNNAFYAVHQKQKTASSEYQPRVTVSTLQAGGSVKIWVKDNGTGISESVKAKIFQPFFTTKPTGEGTGLGLSLSYDIVTKGHGGTLEMESQEGKGTTFIIKLPVNQS